MSQSMRNWVEADTGIHTLRHWHASWLIARGITPSFHGDFPGGNLRRPTDRPPG
jgi:hypothetical protein